MATTYNVINLTDTNAILFSQVNQSSAQTMRRNLANTQGLLSWQVEPSFITDGSLVPVSTLDHQQALDLMSTPEWSDPNPPAE
jgi:hypothetical protein|tara:strand:+ start:1180 stop:1428 length:249 start_codon:yes stop_codon:yes gene_type:complete